MICQHVQIPNGGAAIVCSSGKRLRCAKCGGKAILLCDWKVPSRKSGTCDKPICTACTVSPAPDKDLCPKHALAFEAWRAARVEDHPA